MLRVPSLSLSADPAPPAPALDLLLLRFFLPPLFSPLLSRLLLFFFSSFSSFLAVFRSSLICLSSSLLGVRDLRVCALLLLLLLSLSTVGSDGAEAEAADEGSGSWADERWRCRNRNLPSFCFFPAAEAASEEALTCADWLSGPAVGGACGARYVKKRECEAKAGGHLGGKEIAQDNKKG